MRWDRQTHVTQTQLKWGGGGCYEVNTRAGEGMFPLGLVTMLFLVLFVWGCAGKERRGKGGDTTTVLTTAKGEFVSVYPYMPM